MIPYFEDKDSWKSFLERRAIDDESIDIASLTPPLLQEWELEDIWSEIHNERDLKHSSNNMKHRIKHKKDRVHDKTLYTRHHKTTPFHWTDKEIKKRKKAIKKLLADPGIQDDTMHGLMIDAGSTGSRLHVYEFKKRVLVGEGEISDAVSGRKLSFPGTDSRWTERLSPGIDTFSTKTEEELIPALTEYLKPLIEFAEAVLQSKESEWCEFPIYLKATAGLRMLQPDQRIRVMNGVRKVLSNSTISKFKFEKEYARVISGEEEAIYGWAGVNFVLGSLLQSSEGSGTVMNPKLTHGALEMGGASSQISFYQDNMDIMSGLFKLQIGQGKHWNVYAHSHLSFGINQAWQRMGAHLITNHKTKVLDFPATVQNPCLAGGSNVQFESSIYVDQDGNTKWRVDEDGNDLPYTTKMENSNNKGDYDACAALAYAILNKQYNGWCNFSHHDSCSFAGVYQPRLPEQNHNFGEFLATSNYFHVWSFLKIPLRSNLNTLQDAARNICNMSSDELKAWNDGGVDESEVAQMCFRAVLHNGYGFNMEDNITATDVVMGQKVGWALGSMLYEINTLPWTYIPSDEVKDYNAIIHRDEDLYHFIGVLALVCVLGFYSIIKSFRRRHAHLKHQYTTIDDI